MSDLLLLGRATIEETRSLLHWLDKEEGYGKLGVCGLSMGLFPFSFLFVCGAGPCNDMDLSLSFLLLLSTGLSIVSSFCTFCSVCNLVGG